MTKNSASDALRELAKTDKNRSSAKRLFELIDDVEAALKAGVRRETVLQSLNDNGFAMTLNSFKNSLHSARKKRGKLASTTIATPATPNPLTSEKPVAEQAKVQIEKPVVQTTMPVAAPAPAARETPEERRRRREALADQFVNPNKPSPYILRQLEKLKKEQDK